MQGQAKDKMLLEQQASKQTAGYWQSLQEVKVYQEKTQQWLHESKALMLLKVEVIKD